MSKSSAKMYFAVKLIAPRVNDVKMRGSAIPQTSGPTKHKLDYDEVSATGKPTQLVIGGDPKAFVHGVAGHLVAVVHHFKEADAKKCKTLAEAEQLMKKKHKTWLADAYDWFVFPAHFETGGSSGKKPAKARKRAGKK